MDTTQPTSSYENALAYIASRERFGSKLGLEQIGNLLNRLGNPQKQLKYIHVAGTNGKGSTTAMIACALTDAGYRTGMYISPSVDQFSERIQIDMVPAEDDVIAEAISDVKAAADAMEADGEGIATEFEVVTAAAFLIYHRANCDFVVLETGLGGRYDATNIIDQPLIAVIVSVSYDHMAVLGNTLSAITTEKCGIIKNSCPVVTYAEQPSEVLDTIRAACAAQGSRLVIPDLQAFSLTELDLDGARFVYQGQNYSTSMPGLHFAENALTAIEVLRLLNEAGYSVPAEAVASGIAVHSMTARMEKINDTPCILMDGAHNPDGVEKLCQTIDTVLVGRRLITVMGMFRDKDYAVCIPEIARRSQVFIATTPPSHRALSARETAKIASGLAPLVCIAQRPKMALLSAIRFAGPEDVILCCGSLSFLGDCKRYLKELKASHPEFNIF